MAFSIESFMESFLSGIRYFPNTLTLVLIPLVLGMGLGTLLALVRVYKVPVVDKLAAFFVTVYQGVPIVVALMIYNLLFLLKFNDAAAVFHIKKTAADIDNIWVGIFALTLMAVCSMSESVRGAMLSVDKGQNEAGYSVGLTKVQTIRRIVIPQVIPAAIPVLINNIVGLIKGSSVVMTIGITEVLAGALVPSSRTYAFFEGYAAAAAIYWIFTILLEYLLETLEKYMSRYRRRLS